MRHRRLVSTFAVLSLLACGEAPFEGFESPSGGAPGTAGSGEPTSGGTSAEGGQGGAVFGGGPSGSAGRPASGGTTQTGGAPQTGGAGASGGSEAGEGGTGPGDGGQPGAGMGGSAQGGTNTGGAAAAAGQPPGGGTAGAGGTTADPRCPAKLPKNGAECKPDGLMCNYEALSGCLCTPMGRFTCELVDPTCGMQKSTEFAAPPPEGGTTGRIVPVRSHSVCTCADGTWTCLMAQASASF